MRTELLPIPADFAALIRAREGEVACGWLVELPRTIADLLSRWNLRQDGSLLHGVCAVVLPVRCQDGQAAALKISWLDDETRFEPAALRAWGGHGAVKVLRTAETVGAMLLERLDERRVLQEVPIQEALDTAAYLLRELRVPAPAGLREVGGLAARWAAEFRAEWRRLGEPCAEGLIDTATEVCAELAVQPADPWLLHGDFHYGNILGRGSQGWAAIDPKPLAGDPAFEVVPLLRNRWGEVRGGDEKSDTLQRRLARFAEMAELVPTTMRRWCLVRSVDDALWFQAQADTLRAEISWDIAREMTVDL
ncbi:aminoglycoside phosphotransferase family protein [Buchananella hordeovulneris]|uniref:aminoglycoside phosphotransferase family protein n=1 Tax=Buchananella hordeovulneris TaxID=52770 RepID=UPI00130159A9|nr:aminoglycoside phosphotransferase family protein [Buchananella hordeovulneris]